MPLDKVDAASGESNLDCARYESRKHGLPSMGPVPRVQYALVPEGGFSSTEVVLTHYLEHALKCHDHLIYIEEE